MRLDANDQERPADPLDIAVELEMAERDASVAAVRRSLVGPSLWQCCDCGTDIPAERRALGGVRRCIDCAQDIETRRKTRAR